MFVCLSDKILNKVYQYLFRIDGRFDDCNLSFFVVLVISDFFLFFEDLNSQIDSNNINMSTFYIHGKHCKHI